VFRCAIAHRAVLRAHFRVRTPLVELSQREKICVMINVNFIGITGADRGGGYAEAVWCLHVALVHLAN
jgi:hypothetical protein